MSCVEIHSTSLIKIAQHCSSLIDLQKLLNEFLDGSGKSNLVCIIQMNELNEKVIKSNKAVHEAEEWGRLWFEDCLRVGQTVSMVFLMAHVL